MILRLSAQLLLREGSDYKENYPVCGIADQYPEKNGEKDQKPQADI